MFLVTGYLISTIFNRNRTLGEVSVAPIEKESLQFRKDTDLRHFYELNPSFNGKTFVTDWLDYIPEITITRETLNERFDYPIEKAQGILRIVTLGDSWTYGKYVHTKDNWIEVLEGSLNQRETCSAVKKIRIYQFGSSWL